MKRWMCVIFSFAMCSLLLLGCNRTDVKETEPASKILPDINSFSGTDFNTDGVYFRPIESAVLIRDGKKTPIAPDDERLIRLLNAISYSWNESLSAYITGCRKVEELEVYDESDAPVIIVDFQDNYEGETNYYSKMACVRIVSDSVLLFTEWEQTDITDPYELQYYEEYYYQGKYTVEQHWPFFENLVDYYGDVMYESLDIWANDTYIDLLEYAGF